MFFRATSHVLGQEALVIKAYKFTVLRGFFHIIIAILRIGAIPTFRARVLLI